MAIHEVITELKQPTQHVKKKNYSNNSVLNDVLNETAHDGDWKQMGETNYTSKRMNDIIGKSYGNSPSDNPNGNLASEMGVSPDDPAADFLKKDYRGLMKAINKKKGISGISNG